MTLLGSFFVLKYSIKWSGPHKMRTPKVEQILPSLGGIHQ